MIQSAFSTLNNHNKISLLFFVFFTLKNVNEFLKVCAQGFFIFMLNGFLFHELRNMNRKKLVAGVKVIERGFFNEHINWTTAYNGYLKHILFWESSPMHNQMFNSIIHHIPNISTSISAKLFTLANTAVSNIINAINYPNELRHLYEITHSWTK